MSVRFCFGLERGGGAVAVTVQGHLKLFAQQPHLSAFADACGFLGLGVPTGPLGHDGSVMKWGPRGGRRMFTGHASGVNRSEEHTSELQSQR